MKIKHLGFMGSRSLKDIRVKKLIEKEIDNYNPETVVVPAEPHGVCEVARDFCREMAIPLKVFFLDRRRYARGAFANRSRATLKDCDLIVFIHDGKSKGTQNELEMAVKMRKQYIYHRLEVKEMEMDLGIEDLIKSIENSI